MSEEIVIKSLYKIFGKHAAKALDMVKKGASKQQVLEQTGCVLALKDINLVIEAGDIFSVIGLSGCGKSTLIRNINRLIDPTSGAIYIQGKNVLDLPVKELARFRQSKISMVFQHFGLLPHWTVQQNVAYGLLIQHKQKREALEMVEPWLKKVGLFDYRHKYPDELSGGMKQRVGLARAFAVDTDIILMDEPFSALDPIIRKQMQQLLKEWQTELKKTIIFITHDLDEAFSLGQKVAILHTGTVEQVDEPISIVKNPKTEYVKKFVSTGLSRWSYQ